MTDQFVEDNDLHVPTMISGTAPIPVDLLQFTHRRTYSVDV
jgi:hypothetical protein